MNAHNFDNLTPEQIGEGYRVLAVGEEIVNGTLGWDGEEWFPIWVSKHSQIRYVQETDRVTRKVKI